MIECMVARIGDNVQYRNINTQDDGIITYYLKYIQCVVIRRNNIAGLLYITKVQNIDQAADLTYFNFSSADFLDQSTEVLIGVDFMD